MQLEIGACLHMRTIKPRRSDAKGKLIIEATYTAPKGKTFVLLLLGEVPLGTDVDPEEVLKAWGWTPPQLEEGKDNG